MFAHLLLSLKDWIENTELRRRESYLAGAVDIFDIERRVRLIENSRRPY
ncbi:MAG: DUF3563 family protein [Janthinobacterium lividum]